MYSGSPACFQTGPDCVGATEVQAVARTQVWLTTLVGAHRATRPQALCFVGAGGATPRLDYRSRMRRESHVRFCEGGGVRLPSATRHCSFPLPMTGKGVRGLGRARAPTGMFSTRSR